MTRTLALAVPVALAGLVLLTLGTGTAWAFQAPTPGQQVPLMAPSDSGVVTATGGGGDFTGYTGVTFTGGDGGAADAAALASADDVADAVCIVGGAETLGAACIAALAAGSYELAKQITGVVGTVWTYEVDDGSGGGSDSSTNPATGWAGHITQTETNCQGNSSYSSNDWGCTYFNPGGDYDGNPNDYRIDYQGDSYPSGSNQQGLLSGSDCGSYVTCGNIDLIGFEAVAAIGVYNYNTNACEWTYGDTSKLYSGDPCYGYTQSSGGGGGGGASAPQLTEQCSDGSTVVSTAVSGTLTLGGCPTGTFADGLTDNSDATVWHPPTDWCQQATSQSTCHGQDPTGQTTQYPLCAPAAADFPCSVQWEVQSTDTQGPAWESCAEYDADCQLWPSTEPAGITATQTTMTIDGSPTDETFRVSYGPYVLPIEDGYKSGATVQLTTTPAPKPGSTSSGEDSCFPSGFAQVINPIDWVEKPVECAFSWAFVPDASTVTALESDWQTLQGVPPVSFATAGYTWLTTIGASANATCDVGFDIHTWDSVSFAPLDFCPGSPLYVALHPYRNLLAVALWVSVIAPLVFYFVRTSIPGGSGE